jgi:hypothetical protein
MSIEIPSTPATIPTRKVNINQLFDAATSAAADADRAETAVDAASVNANVFPDIATGRAAVTDGEQFQVVSGDEIIRYRRDSVSTQTEVARYPASAAVNGIRIYGLVSQPPATVGADAYDSITPGAGSARFNRVSVVNSSGNARSRTNAFGAADGERFVIYYRLHLESGLPPFVNLVNSAGTARSQIHISTPNKWVKVVLTANATDATAGLGFLNSGSQTGAASWTMDYFAFREADLDNVQDLFLDRAIGDLETEVTGGNSGPLGFIGRVFAAPSVNGFLPDQPFPGRLEWDVASDLRTSDQNLRAYTVGDKLTIFYTLKQISGTAPGFYLGNADGSGRTSTFPSLAAGDGINRVVLEATDSGSYVLLLRTYAASAGAITIYGAFDGEVDFAEFAETSERGRSAAVLAGATRKSATSGRDVLRKMSSDVRFQQADSSLTGWTADSGASASGQIVTLAGASATVTLAVPADDEAVIFDTVLTIPSTTALNIALRTGSTTLRNFEFAANAITETVGSTVFTPGNNLDMTQRFRVRVFVDTLRQVAQVAVMYLNDPAPANPDKQQHYFIEDVTWSGGRVGTIRLTAGASGAGDVLVEGAQLFTPSYATLGSSIMAGSGQSGNEWNPVPRFKTPEVRTAAFDYWLNDYTGNKRSGLNFGIASAQSADVLQGIDQILKFKPKLIVTDLALTNDINLSVINWNADHIPTTNRILEAISKCEAAGVALVIMEVLPRNAFTEAKRDTMKRFNEFLHQLERTRGVRIARANAPFVNPANANQIAPFYAPDGTHPDKFGLQIITRLVAEAIEA